MPAQVVDGKAIAAAIRREVQAEVQLLTQRHGRPPGIAVILVGDDLASATYVRNKGKACQEVGIRSLQCTRPASISREELFDIIARLNKDEAIDGILVQLPLPEHLNPREITEAIDPEKDVDALHPVNIGRLTRGDARWLPCTPAGILEILDRHTVEIRGRRAVVVGRSEIVGKPIALLLLHRHATVTLCHSRTADLGAETRRADILVAAVGKPRLITADMVKEGAVVIDVGVNRVEGRLVGDVDFDAVKAKASLITSVPGGVGPLTIAMLLKNTLLAYKASLGLPA